MDSKGKKQIIKLKSLEIETKTQFDSEKWLCENGTFLLNRSVFLCIIVDFTDSKM